MDVEKKVVISAGLNTTDISSGMATVTSDAAKMAASVTQSVGQISRTLLDSSRGFDALARNFVDGYRNAQQFAQAIQTAYRGVGDGAGRLQLLPQVLDNIGAKFGLVGEAARAAALKMIDATASQEQRLRAFQSLIAASGGTTAPISSVVPDVAPNVAIVERFNAALVALRDKYDPLAAATRVYSAALEKIANDERLLIATSTQAADARERATATYRTSTAAIEANTIALQKQRAAQAEAARPGALVDIGTTQPGLQANLLQQRLAADPVEQRVAAQRMADVQAAVNRFATGTHLGGAGSGISAPDAEATAARAVDIEAYGEALDKLREQYDPMFAAQRQYERQIAGVSDALKRGAIDEGIATARNKEYAASLVTTQAGIQAHGRNLDNLTGTTWSQQFAMRQLGVQSIQTFSGIATGQPILMTLIQQGHQVVDVALSAGIGLRAMAAGIIAFTTALLSNPITLFIIGIVALTAALTALVIHAQNAAERIGTLQNQLRASRGDAEAMAAQVEAAARRLAQTTALGFDEAFKAGAELAKNPGFQGTERQLAALVNQAHRLSLTLGIDLPAATKIMTRGMDDAAGAAQTLLDQHHFGAAQGVTQAWVDSLKQMTQAQAFQALSDKIAEVTAKTRESFTKLGDEWKRFQQLLSGDGPGFWTQVGNNLADGLAVVLRMINSIIEAWQRLNQMMGSDTAARAQAQLKAQGGAVFGGAPMPGSTLVGEQHYAGMLAGAETQYGLPAGLLSAIAKRESGFDPTAVNKQSGAGGMMQILESTATRPGSGITPISPEARFDPQASIQFAGQYISSLTQRLGSLDAAIKQYSGGGYTAASLGVSGPGTGFVQTPAATIKAADAASTNAMSVQRLENEKKQRDAEAGIRQAQQDMAAGAGTPAGEAARQSAVRYTQALIDLQKAHYDLIEPQQKLARDMEEANRPLQAQEGMTRRLAEVEQQFRQEARGTGVDQEALSRARAAVTERGTREIRDQVTALDLQTNSLRAQIPLIEEGGQAAENAAAFERAVIEARKSAEVGTIQYKQAVIDLTDAFRREIQVKHDVQAATDIAAMTKEMELLQAQARLIGETTMAREQELAVIRQRQSYGLAAGDAASDEQRRAIEQRRLVAGQKVQNDELAVNYGELANATSQAFNTIGDAIAQAFVSGEGAAVSFQNVTKAVIAQVIQEMIKLSIINPILKSLFPGSTGGLADAGGVFRALASGGGFIGGGALGMSAAGGMSEAIGGGLFASGGIFAKGGVFYGSDLAKFSNIIVDRPTLFGMGTPGLSTFAHGAGLMAEAGPEAVIPLIRGADGNLGVRGGGGGSSVSVVVNTPITINGGAGGQNGTMNPQTIKQLQQSIDTTVRHAVRGVIVDERRPGGDLFFR